MARDHARIDVHIWADEDWKALSPLAKLLYLQLISQPRLSYAGLLDLAVKRWARAHPDMSISELRAALSELDNARFVVVDQDTEEVLVRTYIRNDGLYKQPQVLAAAVRVAFDIESTILRTALAAELRRLPVEVTGDAPAVAAAALEAGLREMPSDVKAALAARRTRNAGSPTIEPQVVESPEQSSDPTEPVVPTATNPAAHPSGNPSRQALGEGSRERETGDSRLTLGNQVGVPARTRASVPTREAAERRSGPAEMDIGRDAAAPEQGSGSVRQRRWAEAERLVITHTPAQPREVLDGLRKKVIRMLAAGIEPAAIAAGLRLWASKTLSVSMLPELVGEYMRTRLARAATGAALERDLDVVSMFEQVRASAEEGSVIGQAVRAELPAHISPAELDALLREAGNRALALATAGGDA